MSYSTEPVDEGRDDYTWVSFGQDLALLTRLTMSEAGRVAFELSQLQPALNPHDVFRPCKNLLADGCTDAQLDGLIELAEVIRDSKVAL